MILHRISRDHLLFFVYSQKIRKISICNVRIASLHFFNKNQKICLHLGHLYTVSLAHAFVFWKIHAEMGIEDPVVDSRLLPYVHSGRFYIRMLNKIKTSIVYFSLTRLRLWNSIFFICLFFSRSNVHFVVFRVYWFFFVGDMVSCDCERRLVWN